MVRSLKEIRKSFTVNVSRLPSGYYRGMVMNNGCLLIDAFGDSYEVARRNLINAYNRRFGE